MKRALLALSALPLLGCPPDGRDVVPRSQDVRSDGGERESRPAPDAYLWVARRRHGAVALAEARNLAEADARKITERLADDLEACATRLERDGTLVEGAARVVFQGGERGGVEGLNVRVAPGSDVAANALLCIVAPIRSLTLASKGAALAIEASWQPAGTPILDGGS